MGEGRSSCGELCEVSLEDTDRRSFQSQRSKAGQLSHVTALACLFHCSNRVQSAPELPLGIGAGVDVSSKARKFV